MKIKLLAILFLLFAFGSFQTAEAQTNQQLKIQVGKEKKGFRNKLTIKFVTVLEDSRCPEDVDCVWAGNAKVQIKVRKSGGAWKTIEINSNMAPQNITVEGYEIKLDALTPSPKANVRIDTKGYIATFAVRKL